MAQPPISTATFLVRHNERTKFVAGMLDKLARAAAGSGYIAPVVAGSLPGNIHSAITLVMAPVWRLPVAPRLYRAWEAAVTWDILIQWFIIAGVFVAIIAAGALYLTRPPKL